MTLLYLIILGLDILRLYIRHPQVNTYFTATDRGADFISSLLNFLRLAFYYHKPDPILGYY